MIHRAEPRPARRHFVFLQYPSEHIHFLGRERQGAVAADAVQYLGRGEPFALFVGLGDAEVVVEQLLFRGRLLEVAVAFGHDLLVGVVEPVALAVVQLVHGLGVQLAVVYRAGGVDGAGHVDADEAAAAAGVGQQVLLVAGGDERGVAAHLEHGVGIGFAHIDDGFLEDVLQEALLGDAYLVELVDVDEREAVQVELGVAFAREVDAVGVVHPQFGRHDAAAEGGFPRALRAHQQGRDAVGVFLVGVSPPVCHHAEEPAVEQLRPVRVAAGDGLRQRVDAILPVPACQVVEVVFERVEHGHAVGVDVAADVPVPQRDAFGLGVQGDAVQRALVDGGEAEAEGVALAVFHFAYLGVVAEVVAPFHELVGLQGKQLLLAEAAAGAEAFARLVDVSHHLPDDALLPAEVVVEGGALHGFLFGDARAEAVFGKACHKLVEVVGEGEGGAVPLFGEFGEGLAEGGFEQHNQGVFRFVSRDGARQGRLLVLHGFAVGRLVGHGGGLREGERHGVRAVQRFGVVGETRVLFRGGLLQQDVEGQLGLVALHGKAVGVGVECFHLFRALGQRVVRTDEGGPDFHAPAAGAGEHQPRLRLFPGKAFHERHFRLARQRAYGQFHDAVVAFRLKGAVRPSEFHGGQHFGQAVGFGAALVAQGIAQLLAEGGHGAGLVFRLYLLQESVQIDGRKRAFPVFFSQLGDFHLLFRCFLMVFVVGWGLFAAD